MYEILDLIFITGKTKTISLTSLFDFIEPENIFCGFVYLNFEEHVMAQDIAYHGIICPVVEYHV